MFSRCALLLLGLAMYAAAVQAQCGYDGHDFSSLMGTDILGSDGGSQYKYYLALCGPLTSAAASSCVQVQSTSSACQIENPPNAQTFDIGNYDKTNPPTWSYTDSTQTAITYTLSGATQCWAQGGSAAPYVATIVLKCAPTLGQLMVTSAAQSCVKTYTLPTDLACAGGGGGGGGSSKKGLSGGWVFVIIVLVCTFVYVVAGCVYKSQKLGATGMDKCPNVEFWRDLPGLVKDGVSFTIAKCKALCGGGSSSGGNTYETM